MFTPDQLRMIRYQLRNSVKSINWVLYNKTIDEGKQKNLKVKAQQYEEIIEIICRKLEEVDENKWNK